jgi:hypothetical protein
MRAATGRILLGMLGALILLEGRARGRAAGEAIRMVWQEGDVAGTTSIYGPDDRIIGVVEYHQLRRGQRLWARRIARFADGSSDEDEAEALVGDRLEAVRGRTVIRDTTGEATVDLAIDVQGGRISGTVGTGDARQPIEATEALPPGTYWGPLVFIVLKNFAPNAEDGRVVFRTVVPTPHPRIFDLALTEGGPAPVERAGVTLDTQRFLLAPSLNRILDPLIRRIIPEAAFFVLPGDPPAVARFAGPRNYDRQPIRIQ